MYEEHDTDATHATTLYMTAGRAFTTKRSSGGEGDFEILTFSVQSYDHQFVVHRISRYTFSTPTALGPRTYVPADRGSANSPGGLLFLDLISGFCQGHGTGLLGL